MIRALLAAAILLAGATALGAPAPSVVTVDAKPVNARAQARAQVKKAQLDYKLARFEQALAEYSRAYELYPTPALLFNLGQCHRNLKNHERAIFFFEGYLRE
jgi:tetratricopeptide (TPR) repeat protein